MFIKKIIAAAMLLSLSAFAVSSNAAVFNYSGVVTGATGAFETFTPVGTPVGGDVGVADLAVDTGLAGAGDVTDIGVAVGGFCFFFGAGSCAGAAVPITSVDAAAITFDGAGDVTGGNFSVTAFSPTFMVSIPISFDLDLGTFSAEAAGLGTVSGSGSLVAAPVPVPAAVWLFGTALLGMMGLRRR